MDKIFYYKNNETNEIHQCRIKSLVIKPCGRLHEVNKNIYYLSSIVAEVAGLGLLHYCYNSADNTLAWRNICANVEDAVEHVCSLDNSSAAYNCIFKIKSFERCNNNGNYICLDALDIDVNSLIPDYIHGVVTNHPLFGNNTYWSYATWIWDDNHPKEVMIGASLKVDVVHNKCWLVSSSEYVGKKFYGTAEECSADNFVKVHCF